MYQDFDLKEFFIKHKKRILISIFLFWFLFAFFIILENEISLHINGIKVDPVDRLQYCIRWVLWFFLTPLVINIAIKYPITRRRLFTDISRHFLFALLVISIEFAIEIPLIRYATLAITGTVPPVIDYAAIFILKLNIYFLLYFLIIGTTYLVLYIENYSRSKILAQDAIIKNQQLLSQLTEAKLSLLKMQLDPHFLFNTHHAIISLMLNHENDKAIKMLTKLSDLLRLSLQDQQQTILLESELQLLKLYLEIQQIRFQDRLKISYNLDAKSLNQLVPAFILQPIVENAIKHGIAISSSAENIIIQSIVLENKLIITVENDGVSIDNNNFKEGIGIANTRERLFQLYNNEANFELVNLTHDSVIAKITIPVN